MANNWTRLSGYVIGQRYVLGELVSESDHSATFLTDLPEGNGLAVTIIAADLAEAALRRHSWSVARGLAHPHLLKIHDAGEALYDGKFIYAVKEQPDECLADVIVTRALTVHETRQVVEASLLCLEYLHAKGVAHGAVEPSSVLAVGGKVKLAPDHLYNRTASGFEAGRDMYSLGVTITEVLTCHRSTEIDASVLALPSPFREIAMGCLHPDKAQRWTPPQGLKALQAGSSAHTGPGHPDPMRESLPRTILRQPSARALLAFALLACAALLVRTTQSQSRCVQWRERDLIVSAHTALQRYLADHPR